MFGLFFLLLLIKRTNTHNPAFAEEFPVVGATLGTGYPYDLDMARDPNDVPKTPLPDNAHITITAVEIVSYISPKDNAADWEGETNDVKFKYYAFGGGHDSEQPPKVPGPFLRFKEGRTVTITLDNSKASDPHTIDLHSVVGKKGGSSALRTGPGETATATFTMNNAGLYIYHCVGNGSPHELAHHINQGMFGLILVEPKGRNDFTELVKDATEFYVVQQDVFLSASTEHGENSDEINSFDEGKMLSSAIPDYSVFNGRIGALIDMPMAATAGKNAVLYFGSVGSHISSPHVVGEIFDWVFDQGGIQNPPMLDIQTSLVPSSGAMVAVMDGKQLVPTNMEEGELNIFLDHASPYLRVGAIGFMHVDVFLEDDSASNDGEDSFRTVGFIIFGFAMLILAVAIVISVCRKRKNFPRFWKLEENSKRDDILDESINESHESLDLGHASK